MTDPIRPAHADVCDEISDGVPYPSSNGPDDFEENSGSEDAEEEDSDQQGNWVRIALNELVMNFGQSTTRVITTSAGVIFLFGGLFWLIQGVESSIESMNPGFVNSFTTHLYFSLVTFTTVGFGEFYPNSRAMQFLAGIESLIGAIFMALIVYVLARKSIR